MSTIKVNTIQSNTTAGVDVNSPLETVPSIDVTGSASIGGGLNVTGVVTATSFSGALTGNATGLSGTPNITVGSIIASSATISGNVSVAGTLTYEDVTNVDSIGIVTARTGVRIDAGGLVVTAGVSTFTSGPVFIGAATSTGTASQPLQVSGGAYVSGNLGVGSTNPQYRLDILGGDINLPLGNSIRFGGTSRIRCVTGGIQNLPLTQLLPAAGINTVELNTGSSSGTLRIAAGVNVRGGIIDFVGGDAPTDPAGCLIFRSGAVFSQGLSPERMRLFSTGEVGIGTTVLSGTSSQLLQVAGGAYVSGNVGIGTINPVGRFQVGAGSSVVIVTGIGSVGIATISPQSVLSVGGTITELYNGQFWNLVSQADIGIGASQISVNGMLGDMAFQNSSSISVTNANVTSLNSGQLGGSRNVIINGSMVVNQRGFTGSSGATANGAYTTDRFYISHSMDGAVSAGQTTMNSTVGGNAYADGFNSALHYRVTTADASLSANQYALIIQPIEGFNLQGFKKGTANAQQFTLSFWVRSSLTGTYIVEFYDNDNTRQVSKSYTIDTANTWEKKTLTYPADTTGVFDNDNALSLYVTWFLAAGSTYSGGTLNTSWASNTNANRAVGQVNFLATAGNNFFLTGVQLEVGPTATEFERRSIPQELALCQRYYAKSYKQSVVPGANDGDGCSVFYSHTSGTYTINGNIIFPVEMRDQPTVSIWSNSGTSGQFTASDSIAKSGAATAISQRQASMNVTSGNNNVTYRCQWVAAIEL